MESEGSKRVELAGKENKRQIMADAYGAAGTAMTAPFLSLHSNTLMLLYKSAKNYHKGLKLTSWHEERYTLIEQSNTLIKHSV